MGSPLGSGLVWEWLTSASHARKLAAVADIQCDSHAIPLTATPEQLFNAADKAARDFTKEKSRTDRSKHDDELEKRFDRMMREMEELGRELKRRRSEDKSSPDKPQGF